MVRKPIKVYGRIKVNQSKSGNVNYSLQQKENCEEITFATNGSLDCGFYKNSRLRFRFCSIFDENATQDAVFDKLAKPVVDRVLQGYNGTVFAYGQTGSGKTYTMTGSTEYNSRGVIPRTLQYIFKHTKNIPDIIFNVYISYMEIYNECGYDLLNPKHKPTYLEEMPKITILEDAKGEIHLRNLGVISVASEREALCLLFMGDTNRTIAETPLNMYSSRSHCIFTIHVAATHAEGGRVRRSKLHLVDLAGSERVNKSGISGTVLGDAKQINLSLHYLEQVIIALSDEKRNHIPYRNSVMTTVLRDSLGGNCLTVMLATISADPKNFEETISTCKFAQRVAMVSSEARINEDEDPETRITLLKLEIENLKRELVVAKDSSIFKIYDKLDLSPKKMESCKKEVFDYLKSGSDKFEFKGDPANIQVYFLIMKKIINSTIETSNNSHNDINYEKLIKKKDNEISVLANLLTKEKLKTREANRNNDILNKKLETSNKWETTNKLETNKEETVNKIETNVNMDNNQSLEVLQLYVNGETNKCEVNKCAVALKQKIVLAKKVAEVLNCCKNNILIVKSRLRDAVTLSPETSEKLMSQLKVQQEVYRENLFILRNIKAETDHLNHCLRSAKMRYLQRMSQRDNSITFLHKNIHLMNQSDLSVNCDITEVLPSFYENNENIMQENVVQTLETEFPATINYKNNQINDNKSKKLTYLFNRPNTSIEEEEEEEGEISIGDTKSRQKKHTSRSKRSSDTKQNSPDCLPETDFVGKSYDRHQSEHPIDVGPNAKNQFCTIGTNLDSNNSLDISADYKNSLLKPPGKISHKNSSSLSVAPQNYIFPNRQKSPRRSFSNKTVRNTNMDSQVYCISNSLNGANQFMNDPTGDFCAPKSINYYPNYQQNDKIIYVNNPIENVIVEDKNVYANIPDSTYDPNSDYPITNSSHKYIKPYAETDNENSDSNFIDETEQYILMPTVDKALNVDLSTENYGEQFMKNIPLTGDAEVDQEIIAFYTAKKNVFKSNCR